MDQTKKIAHINPHEGQVYFCNQWVDKKHFRAWVYDMNGNEKLADSYEEFEKLTTNGIWFATRQEVEDKLQASPKQERKLKDVAKLPNSK